MPYRKKERSIAYMLAVLASLAKTIGNEIVIVDLPENVYVPIIGRPVNRYTIKRYAEHVIKYCTRNAVAMPVRKEYVPDKKRGKVVKLVIDPKACSLVAGMLVAELELRKQKKRECSKEIDALRKKLRRCEEKLEKLSRTPSSSKREASSAVALLSTLLEVVEIAGSRKKLVECISNPKKSDACVIAVKIIDTSTTASKGATPVNTFVRKYNENDDYSSMVDALSLTTLKTRLKETISKLRKLH